MKPAENSIWKGGAGMRNDDCALQVYMIRHAQSLANAKGDGYTDWAETTFDPLDPPLSPLGFRQAEAVGKRFAACRLDAVLCSPYLRARQTMEPLLRYQPAEVSVALDKDLAEINTTMTPDGMFGWEDESDEACQARASRFLQRLRTRYHNGESVALVTHAVYIEFLLHAAFDVEYRPNRTLCVYNASVSKLKFYKDGRVKIAVHNDTGHIIDVEGDRIFWI